MKKRDLLWGFVLTGLFVSGSVLWFLWGRASGTWAVIMQDGKELYCFPLAVTREIKVEGEWGSNIVQISPDGIRVTEADCPDGLCQKQGLVRKQGVPIVCLPHKLTVEIKGGGDEY